MSWTLAATGDSGKVIQGLAYLIASSAQFRTVTGAANATAALAFVHEEADDTADSSADRPRAIIVQDEYRSAVSEGGNESSGGALLVSFEFAITGSYAGTPADELAEIRNRCDQIVKEMRQTGGTGTGYFAGQTHFKPQSIEMDGRPEILTEVKQSAAGEEQQTFAAVVYRVTWNGVPS